MKAWTAAVSGLLLLSLLLAACAGPATRVPSYPAAGQTGEQVALDTRECEAWAKSSTPEAGPRVASGAAGGAVIAAGLGAVAGALAMAFLGGSPARGAAMGAALGGLYGAASGAAAGGEAAVNLRDFSYAACMRARGYQTAR